MTSALMELDNTCGGSVPKDYTLYEVTNNTCYLVTPYSDSPSDAPEYVDDLQKSCQSLGYPLCKTEWDDGRQRWKLVWNF